MPDIIPPRHRSSTEGKIELSAPRGRIYYCLDGKDPRETSDDLNPAASPYESPIDPGNNLSLRARVRYKGEWSTLVEIPGRVARGE